MIYYMPLMMERKRLENFSANIYFRESKIGELVTFVTVNRKATSVAKCNTIEMESNTMSGVISQYCGTDVTLDDILENRITNESLSLFNLNRTMVRTQ